MMPVSHLPITIHYMQHALALAARNMGQTWPNPAVGAVIEKDGQIVGRGWTQTGGRPHAETMALRQAGTHAHGATLYVTLEPCAHTGQTGPCAQSLIDAGIKRAFIACRDPDPRVNGKGIAMLQTAGIEVIEGPCRAEAEALNQGFFRRIKENMPYVAVKIATSMDSCIATVTGESQWITGEAARAYGHWLRATHDAIITGIGTLTADNPELTCRLPGMEHRSPVRVVLDPTLRIHPESLAIRKATQVPVWLLTASRNAKKIADVEAMGAEVIHYTHTEAEPNFIPRFADDHGHAEITRVLQLLAERGITRVLVEAGQGITSSFLRSKLVDKLYWFRAPIIIGSDGMAATCNLGVETLVDAQRFTLAETRRFGKDELEVYTACSPALSAQ